jgi:hypothetical protein
MNQVLPSNLARFSGHVFMLAVAVTLASSASSKTATTTAVATNAPAAASSPTTKDASGSSTVAPSGAKAGGPDYSAQICKAIVAAQAGLADDEKATGQPAVPAAYQAPFSIKLTGVPIGNGSDIINDKQVETAYPDAHHAFLKQANISSLATMT